MRVRRLRLFAAALAAISFAACGGGGGGGGVPAVLTVSALQVTTQPNGPEAPFGTTAGGDTMVITGTAFDQGLTVIFEGVAQPVTPQTVSAQQIVLLTPPGGPGFVDVTVRNPDGETAAMVDELGEPVFQYIAPPTVLSILMLTGPTQGETRAPIAGNETVQVTGTGFRLTADGSPQVTVAGVDVATTFVDTSTVTAIVPTVVDEGVVDVVVTNPEGLVSTLQRGLTYTKEFSLDAENDRLSATRARHLYRRAAFGAPQAVIDAAVIAGLDSTVDGLLMFVNDKALEQVAMQNYGANPPPGPNFNDRVNKQWWLHLMANNANGFQDRMAMFMHNHFATSERGFASDARWFLHNQVSLFRRFSMTSADTLLDGSAGLNYDWQRILVEIAKDRAMLDWLDGRVSRVGNPNENFARELWELFMLGEGVGYTETDIQEAARAFTGFFWYSSGGRGTDTPLEMRYRPARHDATVKTIFGVAGFFGYDDLAPFYETANLGGDPADNPTDPSITTDPRDSGGGIVALTLQQRPVEASTFIVHKLWEYFVYEDPHAVVIDDLAAQLRAPGADQWNLKPVIERMLESKAMYSSRAMKGNVKNPIEYAMGYLRTTQTDLGGTPTQAANRLRLALLDMGQVVLDPPDVNGWPQGLSWMGAQFMLERYNFLALSICQLDDVPTQIDPLIPPVGQRSPSELVDHISTLLDVSLSSNARQRYIDYVSSALNDANDVVPAPFDPLNENQLKQKTRGLIWLIAQDRDAHQN